MQYTTHCAICSTRPQAGPSGVSAGHMFPKLEGLMCRGRACLPSRFSGVFTRRRCDTVAIMLVRASICATPVCVDPPFCRPQFPVDSAYVNPSVMRLMFSRSGMDTKRPQSLSRLISDAIFLRKLR